MLNLNNMKKDLQKLGTLLGMTVYIDLADKKFARKQDRERILEMARNFHEQSFRNQDFVDDLRKLINKEPPNCF
jgi:EAL domain-containing protein (putative c-di-GMP-specific phosphodiesterase class I)